MDKVKRDALIIATCCRDWPVYLGFGWGRCGYCGKHPEFNPNKSIADYMREREEARRGR